MDVFACVAWQGVRSAGRSATVVPLAARRAAPATVNRRVAAARAFFEFLLISDRVPTNPVPAPRRPRRSRGRPHDRPRLARRYGRRTGPTRSFNALASPIAWST